MLSLCRVDTPWCAIYITQLTNSYISSQFFLLSCLFLWLCFSFVDQLNEFLAFGACVCVCVGWGAWFMCALSYLSCGRFLCAVGGVMFDWPGSCLLALVDVMAIKLVVSFSANKVLGVTRWRCAY